MRIMMLVRGTIDGCVLKAAAPEPVVLPRGVRLPGNGVLVTIYRDVPATDAVQLIHETAEQHTVELQ